MTGEVQPHNIHRVEPDPEGGRALTLSVVIPAYNRPAVLDRTLQALAAQDAESPSFDVHVADDGSTEDIRTVVETVGGLDIHYHRQENELYGAGQARNLGAAAATGDIVVFLDSDCLVGPGFVTAHAAWHAGGGKTVVIGGKSGGMMGTNEELTDYQKRLRRRTSGLQHGNEMFRAFITSNISMPLALFHEVGGFDERFHRWGAEDNELGWRLWQFGATFLNDESLVVTHQPEDDVSGGWEGRKRDKELNMGLIVSLIPHRLYRKEPPDAIPVTPKVSVLLHNVPPGSSHEMWAELLRQPRSDFELIVVAGLDPEEPLPGASAGDPRLTFAPTLEEGTSAARGEYLCFLDGRGAPSPHLLHAVVQRLDRRPMKVTATVGYGLPPEEGGSVRSPDGAREVDRSWGADMPLCWFIRTREVVKLRDAGHSLAEVWPLSQQWDANFHWSSAAVRLPGSAPTERPSRFTYTSASRRGVALDVVTLRRSPREAAKTLLRGPGPTGGVGRTGSPPIEESERPQARYIGWVGHHNLGDEVMFDEISALLPWADLETTGPAGRLLVLGGGTLINRSNYLKQVSDRDTPSSERCVLGTGVASPDYWGMLEDSERWVRWLRSCAYVGVRGPHSYERLRSWGYKGDLEVSGDSALLVDRPPVESVPGRVVVAPAWTKGRLWGESDRAVVEALAAAITSWRSEGREVVLLSSNPDDDGPILQISHAAGNEVLPFVQGYLDAQQAMETLAQAEVVIGERLHACVLAAAASTPFVPLEYRPKLRDFAASVGVEDLVIRTDELNAGILVERAEAAMAAGTEAIDAHVASYRERLRAAAGLIEHAVKA